MNKIVFCPILLTSTSTMKSLQPHLNNFAAALNAFIWSLDKVTVFDTENWYAPNFTNNYIAAHCTVSQITSKMQMFCRVLTLYLSNNGQNNGWFIINRRPTFLPSVFPTTNTTCSKTIIHFMLDSYFCTTHFWISRNIPRCLWYLMSAKGDEMIFFAKIIFSGSFKFNFLCIEVIEISIIMQLLWTLMYTMYHKYWYNKI